MIPRKIISGLVPLLATLIFLFSPAPCLTQTKTTPAGRLCLTITQTPDTSQAVSWQTDLPVTKAAVQVQALDHFINKKGAPDIIAAETAPPDPGNGDFAYQHSALLSGLKPDTWYVYRVGDAGTWNEWNRFKTAPTSGKPFSFVFFGDIQNQIISSCAMVFRAASQTIPEAGFWLIAGDLVNNGVDDGQWEEFFTAAGWMPRTYPMVPVAGNHEYPHPKFVRPENRKLTRIWPRQFFLPENGPVGLEESCYWFSYGDALFVVLNGNEKLEEQAQWMDSLLAGNKLPWVIVAMHQPAYSTSWKRDNTIYQDLFVPVFDKHAVDLVIQGHDHAYARSLPLKNNKPISDGEKGTVYLMSVSGPKTYPVHSRYKHLFAKSAHGQQWFQKVAVGTSAIRVTAFDLSGRVFDSFVIRP